MIYLIQVCGLSGLYWAIRGKPSDLAFLGRLVAVLALVVSLCNWSSW